MQSRCYDPVPLAGTDPFADGDSLVICYFVTNALYEQLHVGFLFKNSEGEFKLGHVGWHMDCGIIDVPADVVAYWTPLRLDPIAQQLSAWMIESFLTVNVNKLPYSVESDRIRFDGDEFHGADLGEGVTCASFIVDYLRDLGYPIVDKLSWLERPDDEKWKLGMLKALEKVAHEHTQIQRERLGRIARVRPSDVASAASLYSGQLLVFQDIVGRSHCISTKLLGVVRTSCPI